MFVVSVYLPPQMLKLISICSEVTEMCIVDEYKIFKRSGIGKTSFSIIIFATLSIVYILKLLCDNFK